MTSPAPIEQPFQPGDEVVLAEGPYQCTLGVFLRLSDDAKWADITERDGTVRCHPVEWLAHPKGPVPGFATNTGLTGTGV